MTTTNQNASLHVATCIGCACTDEKACMAGCSWERVDRKLQVGVCSECPQMIARWDEGQRKLSPLARKRVGNRTYYARHKNVWRDQYAPNRKAKRAAPKSQSGNRHLHDQGKPHEKA